MINQVNASANMDGNTESIHRNTKKSGETTKEKKITQETESTDRKEKSEGTEKTLSEKQLKQLKQVLEEANRKARLTNTAREYSYDEVTNRICVKVTDKDTEQVIREVPTEESLERLTRMLELAGLVVDQKM